HRHARNLHSFPTRRSSDLDAVVEQSLQKIDGAGEVQEQLQLAEGVKDNEFMDAAEKVKDPEAIKEEVKQKVVKKAVNHFAGRERSEEHTSELQSRENLVCR